MADRDADSSWILCAQDRVSPYVSRVTLSSRTPCSRPECLRSQTANGIIYELEYEPKLVCNPLKTFLFSTVFSGRGEGGRMDGYIGCRECRNSLLKHLNPRFDLNGRSARVENCGFTSEAERDRSRSIVVAQYDVIYIQVFPSYASRTRLRSEIVTFRFRLVGIKSKKRKKKKRKEKDQRRALSLHLQLSGIK